MGSFSQCVYPNTPKEYSGLISFRIDWFDLAVQGTLKSLLQHQFEGISSLVLSLLYEPALTSIALTIRTFVGNVMSLLFNTLSRFDIACVKKNKLYSMNIGSFLCPSPNILCCCMVVKWTLSLRSDLAQVSGKTTEFLITGLCCVFLGDLNLCYCIVDLPTLEI